jgi:hypothetical protein
MPQWAYDVLIGGDVSDEVLAQLRVESGNIVATAPPPARLFVATSPTRPP